MKTPSGKETHVSRFRVTKTHDGAYKVGQKVAQHFPTTIQADRFTDLIEGEIIELFETRDTAYARIKLDGSDKIRLVCLG